MVEPLAIVGVVVAWFSFVLSVWSFVRSSPSADLIRKRQSAMRAVIVNLIVVYNSFMNLGGAQRIHGATLENRYLMDDYYHEDHAKAAKRLEDAIEEALKLGMWETLVTPKKPYASNIPSVTYFCAMRSSLAQVAANGAQNISHFENPHYGYGLIRLLMCCSEYCEHTLLDDSGVMSKEIKHKLPNEEGQEVACTYMMLPSEVQLGQP